GTIFLWDIDGDWKTPLPASFTAHKNVSVRGLAFGPDGSALASAGGDTRIRVWWDLKRPSPSGPALLEGHTPPSAYAVAFSPDGKTRASTGGDGTVRLWDQTADGWTEHFPPRGHTLVVNGLAFLPDGLGLITGSNDRTVRRWPFVDREVGQPITLAKGVPVGLSALAVAVRRADKVAFGANTGAWMFTLNNGVPGAPERITAAVLGLAFSPKDSLLAAAAESKVLLWNVGRSPAAS